MPESQSQHTHHCTDAPAGESRTQTTKSYPSGLLLCTIAAEKSSTCKPPSGTSIGGCKDNASCHVLMQHICLFSPTWPSSTTKCQDIHSVGGTRVAG